jgi:hypothetical protein
MRVSGEDGGYDLRFVGSVGDSGHRFSIASVGSHCLHYVRTVGGGLVTGNRAGFFLQGVVFGCLWGFAGFAGVLSGDRGGRMWCFDGEFVVTCVVDVVA